ncbi:MAG: Smr/MutS family protein [Gemmatimonadales bacterium]
MPKRRAASLGKSRDPFDPLDGPVTATLDLHGNTALEARARLDGFFATARRRHPGGLLHVVTGKGRNSPGRPVLKPLVRGLLAKAPSTVVAAWGRDLDDGGFLVRLTG